MLVAVSSGAGVDECLLRVRRAWIGVEKTFGALLPGISNIVVIG
jgi:hypothetical protein